MVAGPDLNLACRKCTAWLTRIADKCNPIGVYASGQLPDVAEAEFTAAIRFMMENSDGPKTETRFRMP